MAVTRANAQPDQAVPLRQEKQINSRFLDEIRTVGISLPDNYNLSKDSYPVLYLLDGRAHFQHANGAVTFLSRRGVIPEVIIVSIHNIDRTRDFSPVHDDRLPTSGGAEAFLDFIEKELKKEIESDLRASGYSILMGHSFGGTLAAHALNTRPDLFDAFISVSPYLHYSNSHVIGEADKMLKPYKKGKSIYMTVGDEPHYFDPMDTYTAMIKAKTEGTVNFRVERMLSENHGTIPYISLYKGLRFLFSDWQIPVHLFGEGLEAIDRHMAMISAKYGISTRASELAVNQLGYTYLQKGEMDQAISVFKENTERYPGSANVYDSLGEAYEKAGNLKKAEVCYAKACELGKNNADPNYQVYKKNHERVKEALGSQE
jgi:predicted alpha/beta superfamily hydrolase